MFKYNPKTPTANNENKEQIPICDLLFYVFDLPKLVTFTLDKTSIDSAKKVDVLHITILFVDT
jgi:hypothetical protein